jgi:2-succinyl-5-enolpyruvyl-6-hydroxy-3-cyclohexene-1-carboxylate synthase
MLDFRNVNTLWSSILVETLFRLGLTHAIICPGSRSSPLTLAFVNHPQITSIPILDERSASFFALGMAKKLGLPVVLLCTSGTAGANFYSAVIEAQYSGVPLLILTADRPPELLNCHAGQTINQVNLYNNYPNWELSLSLPSVKLKILNYLRQNLICAWEKSLFPNQGVVHINVPFNEPLAPIVNQEVLALKDTFKNNLFFGNLKSVKPVINNVIEVPLNVWRNEEKGVIVGGLCNSEKPEEYCRAIANLSNYLNYPILAEALSPLRNYANLNSNLITNYDFILRNEELSEKLTPQIVIQIGELPTSKILREWLTKTNPQRSIIDPAGDNFDPLHGQSLHLRTTIENISNKILARGKTIHSEYQKNWLTIDKQVNQKVNQNLADNEEIFEAKIAWLLSQNLPEKTPLFIANSMPIRYMEYFWQPNNRKIIPYFSRGTNGIEGTLSTALGIAYDNQSTVILTGDLALLHDTNGFLIKQKFTGHLTIILVNNNGGGIFEMLPIADFGNNFEEYFATPQNIDFEQLCAVYGVEYKLIDNWQHFTQLIRNLPATGIRLLEIQTNRKKDAQWLREKLSQFAE